MGSKHKTDTVLTHETIEIERDLCVFGAIGGGGSAQLLCDSSGSTDLLTVHVTFCKCSLYSGRGIPLLFAGSLLVCSIYTYLDGPFKPNEINN